MKFSALQYFLFKFLTFLYFSFYFLQCFLPDTIIYYYIIVFYTTLSFTTIIICSLLSFVLLLFCGYHQRFQHYLCHRRRQFPQKFHDYFAFYVHCSPAFRWLCVNIFLWFPGIGLRLIGERPAIIAPPESEWYHGRLDRYSAESRLRGSSKLGSYLGKWQIIMFKF